MKTETWVINRMPDSIVIAAELHRFRAAGREYVLAKTMDGEVYTVYPYRSIHLSESWGANETVRRAYCRLSGRAMKDLKAFIVKKRAAAATKEKAAKKRQLQEMARRNGYRLVKVKQP